MIQSTTWLLTEMCKTQLKSDCQDIDPDDTGFKLWHEMNVQNRFGKVM
jgi:hypothetical protein